MLRVAKGYGPAWYLAGATVARVGDDMSGPALLLAGLALTGSPSVASLLLAGVTAAAAVGGPLVGTWLDRSVRPGRVLAAALAGYAAGLALVLWCLGRVPLPVCVAVAVVTGLLGPAVSGGWTSQVPRVVPAGRLHRANALDAMTFDVAALAGPALAGGVAVVSGAPASVVAAAVSVAVAVPVAWRLPARAAAAGEGDGRGAGPLAGLVAIVRSASLARVTAVSVLAHVAEGMLVACVPLLGERALGGAAQGTLLLSAVALSGLLVNAVWARLRRPPVPDAVVWCCVLVQAAALCAVAWGGPGPLVVAVVIFGAAEGPLLTAVFAVRHRESPPGLRARVFTTGASVKITGFAVGAAAAGSLAQWSLPGALVTAAAVDVVAVLVGAALSRRRRG